jgi:acyl dehydratase
MDSSGERRATTDQSGEPGTDAIGRVDPAIAGTRFEPYDFAWDWTTAQLIARAAGCSIADDLDRPLLAPDSMRPGHPLILFNGALLARNRAQVMERLIGSYDAWKRVGRWGSAFMRFHGPLGRTGRGRVRCGFTDVGGTSKGHALVRFGFAVEDADSRQPLADGWMLLFLLGCAPENAARLASPHVALPARAPDAVLTHDTPVNVTFDWAMASGDWNPTHFDRQAGNPAPLVHGPRNMALILHDAARTFAGGRIQCVREITLGTIPAPHFPGERTESRFWRESAGRILARLVVPAAARLDGGTGEKIVIDQIEIVSFPLP